jgi:hypothetical protein
MEAVRRTMAVPEGEPRDERLGQHVRTAVFSPTLLSLCLAEGGACAEGMPVGEEGRRIAEAVQHPASLGTAYRTIGRLSLRQGTRHQALPRLERAVSRCAAAALPCQVSLLAPD